MPINTRAITDPELIRDLIPEAVLKRLRALVKSFLSEFKRYSLEDPRWLPQFARGDSFTEEGLCILSEEEWDISLNKERKKNFEFLLQCPVVSSSTGEIYPGWIECKVWSATEPSKGVREEIKQIFEFSFANIPSEK